jgi:hypothetical protein
MTPPEFSAAFKGSPMKRARLRGLKRDASVVSGNVGTEVDVPALAATLDDPEPLVRSHVAWALGRVGSPDAVAALRRRLEGKVEDPVVAALEDALCNAPRTPLLLGARSVPLAPPARSSG